MVQYRSDLTRTDFHKDIYVHHSQSAIICEKLRFIHDMSGVNARPISALIYGDGGAGKTALVNYFISEVLESQLCYSHFGLKYSISHFDLPIQVTPTKLMNAILQVTGNRVKSVDLGQFANLVEDAGIRIIIIDEFHGLNKVRRTQKEETLELIKLISNKCRIPFILAGTSAVKDTFSRDGQFGRRFKILNVKNWKAGKEFEYFVYSYLKSLPIKLPDTLPTALFDYLIHNIKHYI